MRWSTDRFIRDWRELLNRKCKWSASVWCFVCADAMHNFCVVRSLSWPCIYLINWGRRREGWKGAKIHLSCIQLMRGTNDDLPVFVLQQAKKMHNRINYIEWNRESIVLHHYHRRFGLQQFRLWNSVWSCFLTEHKLIQIDSSSSSENNGRRQIPQFQSENRASSVSFYACWILITVDCHHLNFQLWLKFARSEIAIRLWWML